MLEKISVREIVRGHLQTLRSFGSKRLAPGDFILFFGFPLVVASILILLHVSIPTSATGILATGLSIFTGLLFSVLLLVADIAVRSDQSAPATSRSQFRIKFNVLIELHSNISFAILVAVVALVAVIGLSFQGKFGGRWVLEGVTYYLTTLFFLTLLLILKRAHRLMATEVQEVQRKAS